MSKLHTPAPEVPRDYWGRPLVVPPGGGKQVPYTRCTTFVGALEVTYKLGQWQQRHVARGLAFHPDLLAAVKAHDPDDKKGLNALVDQAKERSGAGDAARMGTYLHAVTEAHDRGWDPAAVPLPEQSCGPVDPEAYVPDLAAYVEATRELKPLMIEQFTVQDPLKIGGTPDRVVKFNGKRYIADLKTGSVEYGHLKIAAQLAVYARSRPYNVETGERMAPHEAELDKGIVIHLPAGSGTCTLYWVNLLEGWDAVRISRDVRRKRSVPFKAVFDPITAASPTPTPAPVSAPEETDLAALIAAKDDPEAIRQLWAANAARWKPEHTELAKARIAVLTKPNPATATEGARA